MDRRTETIALPPMLTQLVKSEIYFDDNIKRCFIGHHSDFLAEKYLKYFLINLLFATREVM